jgi:hypothetical protein
MFCQSVAVGPVPLKKPIDISPVVGNVTLSLSTNPPTAEFSTCAIVTAAYEFNETLMNPKAKSRRLIFMFLLIYSLVFPFTPQINVTHSATYNSLDTTHNNYAFMAYDHSRVEQISITADFYCENSVDAAYWIAATHYLRSVTKMSFGDSTDAGQPPPVVRLNGYGAYVFNNVPVVVKTFTMDLPKDVDYISANVGGKKTVEGISFDVNNTKNSFAPNLSIGITLVTISSDPMGNTWGRGDPLAVLDKIGI